MKRTETESKGERRGGLDDPEVASQNPNEELSPKGIEICPV